MADSIGSEQLVRETRYKDMKQFGCLDRLRWKEEGMLEKLGLPCYVTSIVKDHNGVESVYLHAFEIWDCFTASVISSPNPLLRRAV